MGAPGPDELLVAGPDDWRLWRDARLEALRVAPQAFTRTYAETSAYDEQRWRALLARPGGWWLVLEHGAPVGMGSAFEDAGLAWLGAVYVTPRRRGSGVLERLVGQACTWADRAGHRLLHLEVFDDNGPAVAAYTRLGFRVVGGAGTSDGDTSGVPPAGGPRPYPAKPGLERVMVRPVGRPLPAATMLG